jgi:hypothetical protein
MPPGRPTVFNDKVCNLILEALEKGYNENQACGYAGIGYRTYLRWKSEAQDHVTNTPKKCFFEKVDAALSKREQVLIDPLIDKIVKDRSAYYALEYAKLRLKAKIARDAKESQDKIIDAQIIEITEDQVEWINHVSNYQQ